jgi:hypothetical protein
MRIQRETGAITTIASDTALTALVARSKASEKARKAVGVEVAKRVDTLKKEFLQNIGEANQADAETFFKALLDDLEQKVPITSRIVFTAEEQGEKQAKSYAVAVQNPSLVLAYVDMHGSEHPTIYPLLRASTAYRKLCKDAAAYKRFLETK